jgi:small-conductance mechanosensitive channel
MVMKKCVLGLATWLWTVSLGKAPAAFAGVTGNSGAGPDSTVLQRLVFTGLVILAAFVMLAGLFWAKRRAFEAIEKKRERLPALRFRGLELVAARTLYRNLVALIWVIYAAASLMVTVIALLLVFIQFPHTQQYARQVGLWLWEPVVQIGKGILGYLPNLFYILIVILVTRFILRILAFIFRAAERGVISLEPWIHRDVVRPTAMITKAVIVVVALFFIAPLIPGTGSTAAKGISIILGLMISFGSTSTVGNFVAGIVLMYMRPFQLGDRVKVGETVGDVIERTFLYTKVTTIKNEEVIIPSLTALSAPLINYSTRAAGQGLILHTQITISYDAPWRRVHELLLGAAERTENVLRDPKPFVLQTALNDFYVSYQINVYTCNPERMAEIHSHLHQNIQDAFNEGGVEICSPHYRQLRDGNATTIPASYRDAAYKPGGFRLETAVKLSGSS